LEAAGNILVVDDSPIILELLSEKLEGQGFNVACAESGHEALERTGRGDSAFDLFILDIMLPDMDGFDLAQKVRQHPHAASSSILLLTSLSNENLVRGLRAGADDFLNKEVSDAELLSRVRSLISLRRLRDTATPVSPETPAPVGRVRILVVHEERWARLKILEALSTQVAKDTGDCAEALQILDGTPVDVIISSFSSALGEEGCISKGLQGRASPPALIVVDGAVSPERRMVAFGAGADDYVAEDTGREELTLRVANIMRRRSRLEEERSERKAAEEARAEVAAQAEQLREIDRMKTLFFANISHELRTPLTLLLGPIRHVIESPDATPEEVRSRLELAERNGRRLLRQINLLLDFTKADAGKMELELQPEDPVEIARMIVEETRPAARARNIELTLSEPSESAGLIEIDSERIDQVLLNLVSNAIKFTPEGGRVELAIRSRGSEVELSVSDNGLGIPESELPHMFVPFRQVRRDPQKSGVSAMFRQEKHGTGLGLALVKQLVDLHKGRIEVDSREGVGTTFRVVLPKIVQADGTMTESRRPALAIRAQTELSDLMIEGEREANERKRQDALRPASDKPRILLVDDNPDVRNHLVHLLQSEYELFEAADGQEGIERARDLKPDLIISDVMMPKRSGFELVEELKGSALHASTPILLLTARGGVVAEGLRIGADDYLSKPFDTEELKARVMALLRVTRAERALAKVNQQLGAELEAARSVQQALMPSEPMRISGLEVGARLLSATQLAGDYYDFFPVAEGKELAVLVGDVSGHGASSALVMAVAKASVDLKALSDPAPKPMLDQIARTIFATCKGTKLMTFVYGVIDPERMVMRYSNAGHPFPWCYRRSEDRFFAIARRGEPMGFTPAPAFQEHSTVIMPGDILLFYSDGIVEARRSGDANRPYGLRRLTESVRQNIDRPAVEIASAVIEDALAFSGSDRADDDMTAVVVKIG
jgi:two-component system, sensor histidine kinase ChiS